MLTLGSPRIDSHLEETVRLLLLVRFDASNVMDIRRRSSSVAGIPTPRPPAQVRFSVAAAKISLMDILRRHGLSRCLREYGVEFPSVTLSQSAAFGWGWGLCPPKSRRAAQHPKVSGSSPSGIAQPSGFIGKFIFSFLFHVKANRAMSFREWIELEGKHGITSHLTPLTTDSTPKRKTVCTELVSLALEVQSVDAQAEV